jgi:hypothetical protein
MVTSKISKTLSTVARKAPETYRSVSGKVVDTIDKMHDRAKAIEARVTPVAGKNTRGDLDVGIRVLGAGVSVSSKGDISLGIGGVSITYDPKNPGNSNVIDFGLGSATVERTQEGCTITITTRIMGNIVNQQTRQSDDCTEPEPTPTPTPSPKPDPITYPLPMGKYAVIRLNDPPNEPWDEEDLAWDTYLKTTPTSGYYNPGAVFNTVQEMFEQYMLINSFFSQTDIGILKKTGWGYVQNQGKGEAIGYFYIYRSDANVHIQNGSKWGLWFTDNQGNEIYAHNRFRDSISYPRTWGYNWYSYLGAGIELIPLDIPVVIPKFKQTGRSIPKVTEQCDCELLEDIYDMLGGDKFRDDGLEIPNHLFIPGGTGETKALTYNALLNLMFRTLDHRTVGEVEVSIKDNNIMKEGDQGLTMKLVNATAATGKILELSQKQDSDLTAVLNLLMRLSWISVQILKVVNIGSEATKTIVSFFAIPVKEKVINVDIPVDPSLGGKIGFDPKKPSEDQLIKILDLDDPQKTISIFDKFMNNSKIPVKVKQFIGDRSGGNYWWLMDKNKK